MASIAVDVLLAGVRDLSGSPLNAGLVYTYEPGTTTNRAVYTDTGLTTPAANPVVLDAYGMATVYADSTYKFVVKTSGGTTLYTWDNLNLQAPSDDDFPNGGNAGGGNRTLGNTDNYSLGLLTNNANRVHITNAGDIGINTTSPAFQLHVKDDSATLAGARLESTVNNVATALDLYSNASNANARNWRVQANTVTGNFSVTRSTSTSGAPATAVLDIDSAGKVGIGTTTPSTLLEVAGGNITASGAAGSGLGKLIGNNLTIGTGYYAGINGATFVIKASTASGAGPVSYDLEDLGNGIFYVLARIWYGGASSNTLYSALYLFEKLGSPYTAHTSKVRAILASDAPGTGNGDISVSSTTVTCSWTGSRAASISVLKLTDYVD